MTSAWDELKFYGKLARNLFVPPYDLHQIPGPPGYWGLGHIPHVMRPDYHVQMLEWAEQYGGIYKFSLGCQWVVVVSDPALAAQVLGRGHGSVPRKCVGYGFFDLATNHLGRRSFFTTSDEKQWGGVRKACAPAFNMANVRRSFPHVLRHAEGLADALMGRVRDAAPASLPSHATAAPAASATASPATASAATAYPATAAAEASATVAPAPLPAAAAAAAPSKAVAAGSSGQEAAGQGTGGASGGGSDGNSTAPHVAPPPTPPQPQPQPHTRATRMGSAGSGGSGGSGGCAGSGGLPAHSSTELQQTEGGAVATAVATAVPAALQAGQAAAALQAVQAVPAVAAVRTPAGPGGQQDVLSTATAAGQTGQAEEAQGVPVGDVQEALELALLNVFVEALFDIEAKDFPGHEVAAAMNAVLAEANERLKVPLRGLGQRIGRPREWAAVARAQRLLGETYGYLADVVRSRGTPSPSDTNLWACLARVTDPVTGELLSREALIPEIGAFLMAGFDTSSHTVAWCLFALATHPEVQAAVHAELAEVGLLHGPGRAPRPPTLDDLARLPTLNASIDEAMRMFPVAATASVREVVEPVEVGGYVIPPGVIVWPMLYALHNASHNWEEPHTFKPQRWAYRHRPRATAGSTATADGITATASAGSTTVSSTGGGRGSEGARGLHQEEAESHTGKGAGGAAPSTQHITTHGGSSKSTPEADTSKSGTGGAGCSSTGSSTCSTGSGTVGGTADKNGSTGGGARAFLPFSDGMKSCLGQALGLMEVRTVLVALLSRFEVTLDPEMGGPDHVRASMVMSLTLKIRGGLRLLCRPLDPSAATLDRSASSLDRSSSARHAPTGAAAKHGHHHVHGSAAAVQQQHSGSTAAVPSVGMEAVAGGGAVAAGVHSQPVMQQACMQEGGAVTGSHTAGGGAASSTSVEPLPSPSQSLSTPRVTTTTQAPSKPAAATATAATATAAATAATAAKAAGVRMGSGAAAAGRGLAAAGRRAWGWVRGGNGAGSGGSCPQPGAAAAAQ